MRPSWRSPLSSPRPLRFEAESPTARAPVPPGQLARSRLVGRLFAADAFAPSRRASPSSPSASSPVGLFVPGPRLPSPSPRTLGQLARLMPGLGGLSPRAPGLPPSGPRGPRLAASFLRLVRGFPPRFSWRALLSSPPSASLARGRGFHRAGPRARDQLAHMREPSCPATSWSIRAWLRSFSPRAPRRAPRRAPLSSPPSVSSLPSFGVFALRPRLSPRRPSCRAVSWLLRAWVDGFSPKTPARPFWRAPLSSPRPLRFEPRFPPRGPRARGERPPF